MAISKTKAEFQCEAEKVWNSVTSLENYSWRSDLKKSREIVMRKVSERVCAETFFYKLF